MKKLITFLALTYGIAGIAIGLMSDHGSGLNERSVSLATECRQMANPTPQQYLEGKACVPESFKERFGYEPRVVETSHGNRALRTTGDCSWISDTQAWYDYQQACRTHDYGYDLRRAGLISDRRAVDNFLLADMENDQRNHSAFGELASGQAQVTYWAVRTFAS